MSHFWLTKAVEMEGLGRGRVSRRRVSPIPLRACDQPAQDRVAGAGGFAPSAVSNRICWSGRVPGFNAITVAMFQQCIQGSLYGMGSPRDAMPDLLNLDAAGRLKLDELITRRYALGDVNQAYADMRSGVNIRGVVDFIPAG